MKMSDINPITSLKTLKMSGTVQLETVWAEGKLTGGTLARYV